MRKILSQKWPISPPRLSFQTHQQRKACSGEVAGWLFGKAEHVPARAKLSGRGGEDRRSTREEKEGVYILMRSNPVSLSTQ